METLEVLWVTTIVLLWVLCIYPLFNGIKLLVRYRHRNGKLDCRGALFSIMKNIPILFVVTVPFFILFFCVFSVVYFKDNRFFEIPAPPLDMQFFIISLFILSIVSPFNLLVTHYLGNRREKLITYALVLVSMVILSFCLASVLYILSNGL